MTRQKNRAQKPINSLKDAQKPVCSDYIEGDALDDLLLRLVRSLEIAKASKRGLPEKIWMKQQFAIGVNDVTRVLERMPSAATPNSGLGCKETNIGTAWHRAPLVPLQTVLVAADCNLKWLMKHIPILASTRQVPVFCLKDNRGSSLRLGQVVNVRTELAIGVKVPFAVLFASYIASYLKATIRFLFQSMLSQRQHNQ